MLFGGSSLKTRKFEYKPRYYDPKKEERERKERTRALGKDQSIEGTKSRISESFKTNRQRRGMVSSSKSKSNKMIFVIVGCLLLLFYLAAKDILPILLEKFAI